jgi:TRAP-type C4-dicarboxylate transport system permease large subunit
MLRTAGIAFGSLVTAWLCVWLVGGVILGPPGSAVIATIVTVVLGALIYRDIIRRDPGRTKAGPRQG